MKDQIKEYRDLKIYDEIYILDYEAIKKTYVKGFYKDYENDNSDNMVMYVEHEFGSDHYNDIYEDERSAEHGMQAKKNAYDRYVTTLR